MSMFKIPNFIIPPKADGEEEIYILNIIVQLHYTYIILM